MIQEVLGGAGPQRQKSKTALKLEKYGEYVLKYEKILQTDVDNGSTVLQ